MAHERSHADASPRGHDDEALTALRAELEDVERIPVADRVALFERANTTIAGELASLDEV